MKLLTADFVVPVSGPPISPGGVLLDGNTIIAVGPAEELKDFYADVEREHLAGSAILPGFVNCHSHLELTALRGALDDLDHDFASWLVRLTRLRADVLSDEDIADSAATGAFEGLRAGVTCFGDIGRWGRAGLEALKGTRLRGVIFQETEFSPDNASAETDHADLMTKIAGLRRSEDHLVQVGISPHSTYTVSPDLFRLIAASALEEDLKVTIHAAESQAEQDLLTGNGGFFAKIFEQYGVEWTAPGVRAAEYLAKTGILETGPLLAHCTKANVSEVEVIAEYGARVAHCPKSNAKFGHGVAPVALMSSLGIAVGLGTDSMVSNNVCDLFEEARFAALASRLRDDGESFIQPSEALRMATLGGAEALGMENDIGSLEPGKRADLIAVSLKDVSRLPVNNIESALVFASRSSDIGLTMVDGEVLFREGESGHVDQERLGARMNEIGQKLAAAG